jgi:DNA-binding CsgD family transcriptional regulator
MGISEKTVEHLLSNAMKALRGHRADIYRIVLIFC